jgi:hypothetical protein
VRRERRSGSDKVDRYSVSGLAHVRLKPAPEDALPKEGIDGVCEAPVAHAALLGRHREHVQPFAPHRYPWCRYACLLAHRPSADRLCGMARATRRQGRARRESMTPFRWLRRGRLHLSIRCGRSGAGVGNYI